MRINGIIATGFALSAAASLGMASAQSSSNTAVAQSTSDSAAPAMADQADRLLRDMAVYVGSAQQFTFHADITFDHVLPSGQKLQFSAVEDVALQRPGGLYIEWTGDLGDRQFWYNGKSITLYDPSTPFSAAEPAPSELDSMLNMLLPQLQFSPPLTD